MDLLIFRYSEYEKLYNCSYDINSIPVEQRIHYANGFMMIGLATLFVPIYIPTLIVIWKFVSMTAYQLMFIVGFADVLNLAFGAVPNGINSLTGVVFCSYPKSAYIHASLMGGLWVFTTEMSVVLTLYRCLELVKLVANVGLTHFVADWFFKGKRSLVWISLSVLHSIIVALFPSPLLYSPIFGTYTPNPHAGYIDDIDGKFYNLHQKFYTMALLSVTVVLFIAFVYLMISLRKFGSSLQVLATQQKALVQAVIISSCFAVSITYWVIVFAGSTPPQFAIFIGMTISIFIHGVPGLVYVCMNKTVSDSVRELLRIRKNITTVSIIKK